MGPHAVRAALATVLAFCATALALAVSAAPASAHNSLVSSSPANGASVAQAPGSIQLTFTEPANPRLARLAVEGPGGEKLAAGAPTANGTTVTQPISPGPGGRYTVRYRVVSADGHPVSGSMSFTVASSQPAQATPPPAPAASTPAAAAPQDAPPLNPAGQSSGGRSPWLIVALAAMLLLVAGLAIAARLRPARTNAGDRRDPR
jgi:methionine-rich copper-binding protein CopC